MSELLQVGPDDDGQQIPQQSLGIIFYDVLKSGDPHSTVLVDSKNGKEISRAELLDSSTKLAVKLKKNGLKRGDILTIVSENNTQLPVTALAGFYLGITVNLLNHDYTAGELKHFLSICKPSIIFCTKKTLDNILKLKSEKFYPNKLIIYDDETSDETENFDDFLTENSNCETFGPIELDPQENVAFILTSSGSTGLPKCVQLTHANYRVAMVTIGDPHLVDLNASDVTIGFLPFFHIFGNLVAMGIILFGGKCIFLEKFVPDRFLTIIQEYKITKLLTVPTILLFLVKSPLVEKYDFSSVTEIIYGASPCAKELIDQVKAKLKVSSVRQIYGMTEICGPATVEPKTCNSHAPGGDVTISNTIKVCNLETNAALPANEVGELRIKGGGVMKGYLGNDEATKSDFDEDGFLKTGDLGYYDEDGRFHIVDRLKEVIKCKGFQVSPAELESLLIQYPAVKDAGVIGVPDERAGEVPLAFIVKQPNNHVTAEEIIKYVEGNISAAKRLQGGVKFVEEIPKNASGKILRAKLKELLTIAS